MKPAALITGACGGIGSALCEVYSEAGYLVVGVDLQIPGNVPYATVSCDIRTIVRSENSAENFRAEVLELTGGRLDVLVNNAAVQIVKPCDQLSRDDWNTTLETNLLAPFHLTTLFLPELRMAKGCVVNVGSIHARQSKRNFAAYATSKGALETMTRSLALDLAPEVRVNAIAPAATDTPMLRAGFEGNEEGYAALNSYHPPGRIAMPQEIAQMALYLSGRHAGFITGSIISVDGGISGCLSDPV